MSDAPPQRRRRRAVLTWSIAAVLLLLITPFLVSREVRFVARAAYEEARILLRRRSLEDLAADPRTSAQRRGLFQVVLDARDFAAESLSLDAGDTYTTFADVGRDTLLLVLSACPPTSLSPYVWRYPIAGTVPYKGYFDVEAARGEAERLARRGYDVYLRPAGAFSTLGWFNDPLLSTALSPDSVLLASTVIHEIAHNTLYVPGESRFNESFASFVGYRGAEAFFRSRGDTVSATRAAALWRDELVLAEFYGWLVGMLEDLYAASRPEEETLRSRDAVFAEARNKLARDVGPRLSVYRPERLRRRPLNNASLIAAIIYRTRLDVFEDVFVSAGGDVRKAIATIASVVHGDRSVGPFRALEDATP